MKKNIDLIIDGIAPEKVMYDTDNHSLVVLYPEQKEFKRGDILATNNVLLIFDKYINEDRKYQFHSLWNSMGASNRYWESEYCTHATDEQKAQVHELLRKEGKKWNDETLEIEDLDISEIVVDLETACEYLDKTMPIITSIFTSLPLEDYGKFYAQITLQLIREAWNKFDGFVIDWSDDEQPKYYPVLNFDGYIKYYTQRSNRDITSSSYSFSTSRRAIQFGTQFKELFKIALGL